MAIEFRPGAKKYEEGEFSFEEGINPKKATEKKQQIEVIKEMFEAQKERVENYKIREEKKEEAIKKMKQSLREVVEEAEYHDELLKEKLPEGVFKHIKATGTYIGFYEYPNKEINLNENDDDIAHINMDSSKVLTYVGGDKESRGKLLGQFLPPDSGVTYTLFTGAGQNQAEDAGQNDGGLEEVSEEENYIFVEDVVTNPDMHYFEIPRLGSYIAIPLFVRSYLNSSSFDDALSKTKEYREKLENNKQERIEVEEQFQDRKRQAEENGEDTTEIIEEFRSYEWPELEEPEFIEDLKQYVLCCDTLGMDKVLSEKDREYAIETCKYFVKCWEEKELLYLKKDVDMYIEYENNNEIEDIIFNFNDAEEKEIQAVANDLTDLPEDEAIYKQDEARLNIVREQLINEDESKTHLLSLSNYQFIKYHSILQNAFFLINYKKEDINEPGTNVMNWRKVRKELFNEDFYTKVMDYQYKGPKEGEYPPYAYINRIKERLEKINQDEVNNYNLGLGRLLRYIYLISTLRIQDILLRKEEREQKKKEKADLEHKKQVLQDRRIKELEEAKVELEEEEEFDQEEWLARWDDEHSDVEIPDDVEDERDDDLEPGFHDEENTTN